jgi:hypothetical protein
MKSKHWTAPRLVVLFDLVVLALVALFSLLRLMTRWFDLTMSIPRRRNGLG